jgi:tRNA G37 N-methylase Trm5
MRHLSVPSAQTQHWLERCRSERWLAEHTGVTTLSDGNKAIPLNEHAPKEGHEAYGANTIVDIQAKEKQPSHWTAHLDSELFEQHKDDWPKAFETQGDVLIVKIEDGVWGFAETIADAMLTQLPNIRLVCADLGVQGDFRVRDLLPLASRDGSTSTRTRIKENGYLLWVDASKVYFSTRLSNERTETLGTALELARRLDRGIVVADPYAGVGPSMGALLGEPDLLSGYLAGDLNPDAVNLLTANISHLTSRRKSTTEATPSPLIPSTVVCADATQWIDEPENINSCDLLLVNLPHDSIAHLPRLLPLLRREQTTVLRGWAIIERTDEPSQKLAIASAIENGGGVVETMSFSEVKGFSASKIFMCFEAWIYFNE